MTSTCDEVFWKFFGFALALALLDTRTALLREHCRTEREHEAGKAVSFKVLLGLAFARPPYAMDAKDILGVRGGAGPAAPVGRKQKEAAAAKPKGVSREVCTSKSSERVASRLPRCRRALSLTLRPVAPRRCGKSRKATARTRRPRRR